MSSQPAAEDPSARAKASPRCPWGTAKLTMPSVGIHGVPIISYRGTPDDRPGTVIQDRGDVAAACGKWGGVQPGQVGNLILTGHRTSAGAPMVSVPDMKNGDRVVVSYKGTNYTYKITERLWINFREKRSRNSQRLPVPGKYGVAATRPAMVLSTCATPEDNAAGLFWRDENHNPTHRIALVGYLVGS